MAARSSRPTRPAERGRDRPRVRLLRRPIRFTLSKLHSARCSDPYRGSLQRRQPGIAVHPGSQVRSTAAQGDRAWPVSAHGHSSIPTPVRWALPGRRSISSSPAVGISRRACPGWIAYVALAPKPELAFVAFPTHCDPPPIWGGVELRPGDVVFHSRGEGMHQRTSGPSGWSLVSLTPEHLAVHGKVLTGQDLVPPPVGRVLRPPAFAAALLRRLHAAELGEPVAPRLLRDRRRRGIDLPRILPGDDRRDAVGHPAARRGIRRICIAAGSLPALSSRSGSQEVILRGHRRPLAAVPNIEERQRGASAAPTPRVSRLGSLEVLVTLAVRAPWSQT
jgi:hypothetical protein